MIHQKNSVMDFDEVDSWLKKNLAQNVKTSLYFDATLLDSPLTRAIFGNSDASRRISTVIVNGPIPKTGLPANIEANKVLVISKKIEIPVVLSLSIGKKAYMYLDSSGVIRSASDDLEIGKVLDQIHSGFESLAW